MANYTTVNTKGRLLHLLSIDKIKCNGMAYLDASRPIKEAERVDRDNGYKNGGPNMGQEVSKASQYADYVGKHATADNLHNFYCNGYFLFIDKAA